MRRAFSGLAAIVMGSAACGAAAGEVFERHVVVAQEGNAADAGRDVMRGGGNAVDAAVATAFALAVTHPSAGNLGGGGFLVAFLADRGTVVSLDFREVAPRASGPRMYLGPDGKLIPRHRAGARAAGVPGTVRGLGLAHARFGRAAWADLVRPAARLAREGFAVSAPTARSLNQQLFESGPVEAGGKDDLGTGRPPPGRLPRVGRRLSQARRRPLARGGPARPARPRRDPGPDRRVRPRRVLHGQDGAADRRFHGGARGPDHPRRPGRLSGPRAIADARHIPGLRRLRPRPPGIGRDRRRAHVEHARTV